MPVLDARHDRAHPVEPDDPRWSESYYFNGYSPRSDGGLVTRIGIRPNEGRVEAFLGLWPPGGGVVHFEAERPTDRMFDGVLEVGGLRYTMEEPTRRWRIEGEGISADGRRLRLDARFEAATPALGFDGQGGRHDGSKAIVTTTMASGHLEQAGRWSGTAEVGGVTFALDGGRGNRDKSWGPREPKGERPGLQMWRWFSVNAGEELQLGGIRMGTASGDVHRGWIWQGGRHRSIRRWDLATVVAEDAMTPRSLDAVVTDKEGDARRLHGEILRVWPLIRDETTLVLECLTRWEVAGIGAGYGIAEYMHRLDAAGRPERAVE